jgi:hypothetical protein
MRRIRAMTGKAGVRQKRADITIERERIDRGARTTSDKQQSENDEETTHRRLVTKGSWQ